MDGASDFVQYHDHDMTLVQFVFACVKKSVYGEDAFVFVAFSSYSLLETRLLSWKLEVGSHQKGRRNRKQQQWMGKADDMRCESVCMACALKMKQFKFAERKLQKEEKKKKKTHGPGSIIILLFESNKVSYSLPSYVVSS